MSPATKTPPAPWLTWMSPLRLIERLTSRPIAAATRGHYTDSILYGASSILPRMFTFLLTPIITRRLVPGSFAIFDVYVRAIAFLCIFLSLQSESAVARYYYEEREDFPDFLGTAIFYLTGLAAVMTAQFWFFRDTWARWLQLPVDIYLLALITALAQIAHQIYMQLLLSRRRSRPYFAWSMVRQIIYVVLAVTLLFTLTRERYRGLIWANMLSTVLPAIVFLALIVRLMRPVFRRAHLVYTLRFTLPTVAGAFALFGINFFDRFFIYSRSQDAAGQYSFAYNMAMLIQIMTTGVFAAYTPRFYQHQNRGETGQVQRLFSRDFKLFLLVATLLILISRPLAILLGRPSYFGALPIVPSVVTAYLFLNLSQYYGLYMGWRRKYLVHYSVSLIIASLANILLNVWLIPIYGPIVAGPVTMVSFMLLWLQVMVIAKVFLKEKTIGFRGLWWPFAAYLTFVLVWSLVGY